MKQSIYLFLIFSFTFVACKHKSTKAEILPKNLSKEEMVQKILTDEYATFTGIDHEGQELLYRFYETRNFKPLWSNKHKISALGEQLISEFKHGIRFGIASERNSALIWSDDSPIHNEIVLMAHITRSYYDLKEGYLDSAKTALKPIKYVELQSIDTLINFDQKSIASKVLSWGIADSTYQQLANALYTFATTNDMTEKSIEVKSQKTDAEASVLAAREVLTGKKYLANQTVDSLTFVQALKQFQREIGLNPDGLIGENTAKALMETPKMKAEQIALAMEKQRWKSKELPKRYVYINLPEFMLRFYDDDTLRSENKIVIGKPQNSTPELSASIYEIVVYPYWGVPYSIASKEVLPALKNNPNYLARNKMRIYRKDKEIDPATVNWKKIPEKTFPYSIKQDPGTHNSLGILKFEFYNKYDVYVHDTPQKGLFKTISRAYSHGCMRSESPIDLAKIMLERDENVMTADSLDTLISRVGENFKIKLKKRVPIFIVYRTVVVQNGSLRFFRDVYGKDERMIEVLFGEKRMASAAQ